MYQAQLPFLKERVLAALLLFAFAIAMVTMTTFAWNTLSVSPEVSGATTTITSNGNLEIALAGQHEIIYEKDEDGNDITDADGNKIVKEIIAIPPGSSAIGDSMLSIQARNQTWGNLINLSDPSYGLDQIILRPTTLNTGSLAKKPFVSATYGPDGRVENDKNSNFGYTKYLEIGEGTGIYGFLKSDVPGVKAVSSILAKPTHIESKLGLFYTEMINDTIPIDLLGDARNQLNEIVKQMDLKYVDKSPLSSLMGTYLNGMLYKTLTETAPDGWTKPEGWTEYKPIACNRDDMQSLYDLMVDLDAKVLHTTGEAFAEIFYLYQMDTYVNKEAYDALENPEKDFIWPDSWTRFAEDSHGLITEEGLDAFCREAPALIDAMNKTRVADNQIPGSFKTTITNYKNARDKLQTALSHLEAELAEGDEIYWYEVGADVNSLVNIESTQVNGKTLASWFSSLSQNISGLLGILSANETGNNAIVTAGVIRDIDALLYGTNGGIWIQKISVFVEGAAIKNRANMNLGDKTILANVKTNAPQKDEDGNMLPSLSSQLLVDATATLDTGYVVYNYQALDTYGLAIDFWIRTNVPSSSLILEGEVIFKDVPVTKKVVIGDSEVEVEIYLADIKITTAETGKEPEVQEPTGIEVYKQTEDGKVVWYYADSGAPVEKEETIYGGEDGQTVLGTITSEISGTPTQKIDKIPDGYSAANRIWDKEDLPFGMDEAQYSTSQGSGSCYTFYADPTELNTILGMLELMRVAFVDADGNLLAIAKLDTQYCFSEYGRHLVPLVLYSGYEEQTVTDPKTGQTTTYRTIMGLNTNEPTLISALIYLEGNSIENKDVLSSADIKGQFNIQFGTTYDKDALKDQDLMNEKILVSAEIADKSQTGTTYVKTVTTTVTGAKVNSVKANFTRRISSTQGSLYYNEDLSFTDIGDGKWVCDFTFATPGTYILRSVTVDGQERMLQKPIEFTIDGFKIENLQSSLGPSYTFMTADSYVTDSFTLKITASEGYELPKTVKGIFTNENNVNVDLNFKKGTNDIWTASVAFNASGTYTLRYLLLDGEYYEVNPFIREVSLGLKTKVWLTAPKDFMDNEDYRYDLVNDVHNYFYMGKEHKFDAVLEIYDESGKEIKQLGGTEGVELVYNGISMKLKWNPSADNYSGAALTLNAPGSYSFTSVIIPMETGKQTVTATSGATRVVSATKDPYEFLKNETRVPVTSFNAIFNPTPDISEHPRVDMMFNYASAASMFGKFKVVDGKGNESFIVVKADYTSIDETSGYFSFKIPTNEEGKFTDGFYQLVEVKFTNVMNAEDEKFYQSNADLSSMNGSVAFDEAAETEFLTITFGTEEYAELDTIKIVANLEITVEDGKQITSTFDGAFLEPHTLFSDGVLEVVITDFDNKAIVGLGDLSLTIKHNRETMNQYYTVSDNDYNSILSTLMKVTLKDEDGDGVYSTDVLPDIFLAGTYSITLELIFEDQGSVAGNNKEQAKVDMINAAILTKMPGTIAVKNSVLPSVAITEISPTGTGAVDTTDSNPYDSHTENHKAGAFSSGYAEVYFRCDRTGDGSFCSPYEHNYTRPSVAVTLANIGNADSASLNFGDNVHVYNGTTQTTGFAWTENGACARNIGNYKSGTKTHAGIISASVLTLSKDGISYMIPISSMNLTDLSGAPVTSITMHNPY